MFQWSFSSVCPFWLDLASRPLVQPRVVPSGPPFVVFAGSRSLFASPLIMHAVESVLAHGASVSVGCSSGVDAAVIRWVLACGGASRLRVFAVGDQSGAGFWARSALPSVRLAERFGAAVSWCAGGPLSLPLRFRLAQRASRAVWWAARSGPGSGFVGFVSSGRSVGTWRAARLAARLGLPVVVFDTRDYSLPPLFGPGSGSWVTAGSCVWWFASRWVPA